MPCETAKAVLETSSLRWKAPKQFNDPFDHQVSFIFSYTQEQFSNALFAEIERLIYERDEPNFLEETGLSIMTRMLRKARDKIPRERIIETLKEGVEESAQRFQQYQDNINALIANDLNRSRVLCVSERNDNIVMWSHYANSHTGVCIRLQCIDEVDNALLLAKPIKYTDSFPIFPSLDQHIKHLTGERPIDFFDLLYQVPFVKHEHWSYENEWRVHVPHDEPENLTGFNDWKENPSVFGAIYFGCRINQSSAAELMRIIDRKFPQMEVYSAKPSVRKFEVEFTRLK